MKNKFHWIFIAAMGISCTAMAQTIKPEQAYPVRVAGNVLNWQSDSIRLPLNHKATILYYWSHSCTSCITSFPKIDAMQKKYGKDVQFVLLNKESLEKTAAFFKMRDLVMPSVPFVNSDDHHLGKLYNAVGYPVVVWIDKQGITKAVTRKDDMDEENISKFSLSGNLASFTQLKKVFHGSLFDYGDSVAFTKVLSYSHLSRFSRVLHVSNITAMKFSDSTVAITRTGSSVVDLYLTAYNPFNAEKFSWPASVELDVANPSGYHYDAGTMGHIKWASWAERFGYSYELVLPLRNKHRLQQAMQQDLERHFGLKVSIERKVKEGREIDVLVLSDK